MNDVNLTWSECEMNERCDKGRRAPASGPLLAVGAFTWVLLLGGSACRAADVTQVEARTALHEAAAFFSTKVASHGGYLWRYSGDLSLREGEGPADRDTIWVQPPGTPAVGDAFLDAYDATGDSLYLQAARAAADALLLGQLHSGGWHYRVTFDPKQRSAFAYRYDLAGHKTRDPVTPADRQGSHGWHVWRKRAYRGNVTFLDDDTTQAALRFLMRIDKTLDFKDDRIHESVMYGLDSLLAAQYPNGAWSHNYDRFPGRPPDADRYPVKQASYPSSSPATWPKAYAGCYMLNDAITPDAIATMLYAWQVYGQQRFVRSATRGGDFLLLAQMPEPQPAWAQQYDPNMHPVWDRAFEPPAISGRESQTVLQMLLTLARQTGERRFLEPVPRALEYLRRSQLPDGRLARFYELRTNRPLYFTRDADGRHQLTYAADRLVDHYQLLVESRLDEIEAEYEALKAGAPRVVPGVNLSARVAAAIGALDQRGAWAQTGRLAYHKIEPESGIIDCRTFIDNVTLLCTFLRAERNDNGEGN